MPTIAIRQRNSGREKTRDRGIAATYTFGHQDFFHYRAPLIACKDTQPHPPNVRPDIIPLSPFPCLHSPVSIPCLHSRGVHLDGVPLPKQAKIDALPISMAAFNGVGYLLK